MSEGEEGFGEQLRSLAEKIVDSPRLRADNDTRLKAEGLLNNLDRQWQRLVEAQEDLAHLLSPQTKQSMEKDIAKLSKQAIMARDLIIKALDSDEVFSALQKTVACWRESAALARLGEEMSERDDELQEQRVKVGRELETLGVSFHHVF